MAFCVSCLRIVPDGHRCPEDEAQDADAWNEPREERP